MSDGYVYMPQEAPVNDLPMVNGRTPRAKRQRSRRANISIMVFSIIPSLCLITASALQLTVIFKYIWDEERIDFFATIVSSIIIGLASIFVILISINMKCWDNIIQDNFGFIVSPIGRGIFLFLLSFFFNINFHPYTFPHVIAYSSFAVASMVLSFLLSVFGCACR